MKTKSTILGVIKVFITLLVSVSLFSCETNLPTNNAMKTPYFVESIETFKSNGAYCKYNLETRCDYSLFQDNISVIDSIGKFMIGDSVRLSLNKR